jgi:hypothetical protein
MLQTMKNNRKVAENCGDHLSYFQTDVWSGYSCRLTLPRKYPRLSGHHLCMQRFSETDSVTSHLSLAQLESQLLRRRLVLSFHLPVAWCYLSAASTSPKSFASSARSNPCPSTLFVEAVVIGQALMQLNSRPGSVNPFVLVMVRRSEKFTGALATDARVRARPTRFLICAAQRP